MQVNVYSAEVDEFFEPGKRRLQGNRHAFKVNE